MPIIKSAKKRVRGAKKAAIRNSKTKRSLRGALKVFHKAATGGDKKVTELHSKAQSELDKAVKKGIIHKNKAAREKRKLAAKAKNAAGAAKPAAAKKPVAKKPAVKKAPAKKPTTKK